MIASITDRNLTSDLAIRTLQKALESQLSIKDGRILHSDQGSQDTSKAFTEFCESVKITQSMSKAGYPYDNAPMERYFNTAARVGNGRSAEFARDYEVFGTKKIT